MCRKHKRFSEVSAAGLLIAIGIVFGDIGTSPLYVMTTYFVGGSMGTFLAGSAWQAFGWHGVIGMGVLLTSCSLLITFFSRK